MIVFACGLSRSGKSTLIEAAGVEQLGFRLERASHLLRSAGRPTAQLKAADVLPNQNSFVAALREKMGPDSPILIDGHLLIETVEGPQLVPETCLDPLPIGGILVIEASPEEVFIRRMGTELSNTIDELADRMVLERIQAQRLGRYRKVPVYTVMCDDVHGFRYAIGEVLRLVKADDR